MIVNLGYGSNLRGEASIGQGLMSPEPGAWTAAGGGGGGGTITAFVGQAALRFLSMRNVRKGR